MRLPRFLRRKSVWALAGALILGFVVFEYFRDVYKLMQPGGDDSVRAGAEDLRVREGMLRGLREGG